MVLVYGAGEDFHEFTFHDEPQNSYVVVVLLKLALAKKVGYFFSVQSQLFSFRELIQ